MTLATVAIPSVAHQFNDDDIVVVVAFRRSDPIGMTSIEIDPDKNLSHQERQAILTETALRLQANVGDCEAAERFDHEQLVGYNVNGWPCCVACFAKSYILGGDGVAYPRESRSYIQGVRPIHAQRITCTQCGESHPWIPRVIEGGRP